MKPCSDKLKVLFILPTLGAGGAERVLITLLNNLDRDHFEPEFLALNGSGPIKEWIDQSIPFHSFGERSIKTSIFKLVAFIKDTRPDVIFTTMVHSNALVLLMKIFFPHIRVIIREAALPSILVTRYGIKGRLCKLVYKLLYGRADLVVSNCSQMIDDFETSIKISTHNHQVLFNPVDTDRLYANMPDLFEVSEKRKGTVHFVSVGRLSYEKGYDRLFKALSRFQPDYDWRLDLIGDGDYRATLEELIIREGLQDHVFLLGYASNPWEVAAASDCLLLPSRWEGMPNVVLEGFACGLPAIATRDAGGISDIAEYTKPQDLVIVDTMDEFVNAMMTVCPRPVISRESSILPSVFLLSNIIKNFEDMLRG